MSKPLEPTEEQETALANLLLACGSTRGCEATDAVRVWDLVRDMVLEEATKVCCRGLNHAAELAAADRIRAMKGSP